MLNQATVPYFGLNTCLEIFPAIHLYLNILTTIFEGINFY